MVSPAVVGPAPPTPLVLLVVLALAPLPPPADVTLVALVAVAAPDVEAVDVEVTAPDVVDAPVAVTPAVVVPITDAVSVVPILLEVTTVSLPVLVVVALSLTLSPFDSAGVEQPRSPKQHTSPACERTRRSDTASPVSYSFAGPAMTFACARACIILVPQRNRAVEQAARYGRTSGTLGYMITRS